MVPVGQQHMVAAAALKGVCRLQGASSFKKPMTAAAHPNTLLLPGLYQMVPMQGPMVIIAM